MDFQQKCVCIVFDLWPIELGSVDPWDVSVYSQLLCWSVVPSVRDPKLPHRGSPVSRRNIGLALRGTESSHLLNGTQKCVPCPCLSIYTCVAGILSLKELSAAGCCSHAICSPSEIHLRPPSAARPQAPRKVYRVRRGSHWAHTHTHTHWQLTQTHTQRHADTLTDTHSQTRTSTHTHTHRKTCTSTHTHRKTCTSAHTQTNKWKRHKKPTQTDTHMHYSAW